MSERPDLPGWTWNPITLRFDPPRPPSPETYHSEVNKDRNAKEEKKP